MDVPRDSPGKQLACGECNYTAPVIAGRFPVLTARPHELVEKSFINILAQIKRFEEHISDSAALGIQEPLKKNLSLLESMKTAIGEHVDREGLLKSHIGAAKFGSFGDYQDFFPNLRRDWGGRPECERELALLQGEIGKNAAQSAPDGDFALVLGAGCGRFAYDLRRSFRRVLAVELSLPMSLAFHGVESGGIKFYEINEKNVSSPRDRALPVDARIRRHGKPSDPEGLFDFCVADGLSVPIADGTVSCVISAYFTDVVPAAPLLKEIQRLLKPRGSFIHVGPLQFHFDRKLGWPSKDELLAQFSAEGFRVKERPPFDAFHCDSSRQLEKIWFRNFSFSATKKGTGREISDDCRLILHDKKILATRRLLSEGEDALLEATIENPGGEPVKIGAETLKILSLIDGKRSVAQLWDAANDKFSLGEKARPKFMNILAKLLRDSVLKIR